MGIDELFEVYGESGFREKEAAYLRECLNDPEACVLALGGGTPCFHANMDEVLAKSKSIYLELPVDVLVARLSTDRGNRPLLLALEGEELRAQIKSLYEERRNYYEKAEIHLEAVDFHPSDFEKILPELRAYLK